MMVRPMQIDPKILEEVGRAICIAANKPRDPIYDSVFNIANPMEMANAAIIAYERLRPSPWLPIEEAKGLESQTVIVGRFVGDVLMWAYTYDTLHFQRGVGRPEQWSDGVPTHLMLTPKAPEGK